MPKHKDGLQRCFGTNGLIARYSFDNPADLGHDDSGNGWNGILFGNTTSGAAKVGAASIELDGDGDYVLLPNDVKGSAQDIIVATWVWTDDTDLWQRAWDFGTGTNQYVMYAPYGDRRFVFKNGGGEQFVNPNVLTTGQWYHVACVLEGDTGSVYVNGTKVAETPKASAHK